MLTLTERAGKAIHDIRNTSDDITEEFLRVKVIGGGCSGFSYDFFFEDKTSEDDFFFESQGVKIYVDMMSLQYLDGTEIDYVESPIQGGAFKFINPNAKSTCGCGSSFSV